MNQQEEPFIASDLFQANFLFYQDFFYHESIMASQLTPHSNQIMV